MGIEKRALQRRAIEEKDVMNDLRGQIVHNMSINRDFIRVILEHEERGQHGKAY